jgi:hypothetical protein
MWGKGRPYRGRGGDQWPLPQLHLIFLSNYGQMAWLSDLLGHQPHFKTPISPASKRCLKQCCDSHTEENGPNELAGGPLVIPHTHGISQQKGHCNCSTEACQVVLWGRGETKQRKSKPSLIFPEFILTLLP